MPLIEKATAYVLGALLQNEEFKKFPQDFISASVEWVRSWFLKDDPKTEAKLSSDKSIDYKQAVVEIDPVTGIVLQSTKTPLPPTDLAILP